ncbi:MAG TPA: c-type cytochrome [Candidatus Binatia bacterium]|nr:c-type cytochrome [Candidatus Binatia bacterium]
MLAWLGWRRVLALALVIETAYLIVPTLRNFALSIEESEPARGRRMAASLGCFNCHGPEGRGNVPNHGSQLDTVPGFTEQTLMMFVKNEAELREYILDGAPRRRRDDPAYQEKMAGQAIRMPAFRGWISERDLDALIAYLRLVSGFMRPKSELAVRGEELANSLGCFACHGELGMGGRANPGALKDYIPGFLGADFHELVRDDDELMTWLRDGALPRISDQGLGRFFFNRQRIRMPAYKGFVSETDLQAIATYVRWLAGDSWRSEPLLAHE